MTVVKLASSLVVSRCWWHAFHGCFRESVPRGIFLSHKLHPTKGRPIEARDFRDRWWYAQDSRVFCSWAFTAWLDKSLWMSDAG